MVNMSLNICYYLYNFNLTPNGFIWEIKNLTYAAVPTSRCSENCSEFSLFFGQIWTCSTEHEKTAGL